MDIYSINVNNELKNYSIKFLERDEEKKQVIYILEPEIVEKIKCPHCNNEHVYVNKYYYVDLKNGINDDGYIDVFRVKIPNYKCISNNCGKTFSYKIPFRYKNYKITISLSKKILNIFQYTTCYAEISKITGVNEIIVKNICDEKMDKDKQICYEKIKKNKVKKLCIDENFISKKHGYYTIFQDHDTGAMIYSCKGRGVKPIYDFSEKFGEDFINNIEEVCVDMSFPYISGVLKYIPNAKISLDKFHIIKNFNYKVVKPTYAKLLAENKKAKEIIEKQMENGIFPDAIKETYKNIIDLRQLLIKNRENLKKTKSQLSKETILEIEKLKENYIEIFEIRDFRDKIDELMNNNDYDYISKEYDILLEKYLNSKNDKLKNYCKTIKNKYIKYIKNISICNISNGVIESFNKSINQIINIGRGYKNVDQIFKIAFFKSNLKHRRYS